MYPAKTAVNDTRLGIGNLPSGGVFLYPQAQENQCELPRVCGTFDPLGMAENQSIGSVLEFEGDRHSFFLVYPRETDFCNRSPIQLNEGALLIGVSQNLAEQMANAATLRNDREMGFRTGRPAKLWQECVRVWTFDRL